MAGHTSMAASSLSHTAKEESIALSSGTHASRFGGDAP